MNLEPEEAKATFLDVFVVLAENIRLLVLGPVVVGLIAFAITYVLPQSFVSQAILSLPNSSTTTTTTTTTIAQQAAAMLVSPLVLDPIIETQKLSQGRPLQVARERLVKQIKAVVGKDGLLRLDVTDTSEIQAQSLANAVIDGWLKTTAPSAREREDLERRLEFARNGLKTVTLLLERLSIDGAVSLNKPLTRGEAGTGIVALGELQARYLADVLAIPRVIQGLSRDVVKQPPTLPTEAVSKKAGMIALIAVIGTGFALLSFVFMRQAWDNAAIDPKTASKQDRLRRALGWKSQQFSQ